MSRPTYRSGLSRRDFLKASAVATVATALVQANGLTNVASAAQGADATLLGILNYALTLEHLESRAYATINGTNLLSGEASTLFKEFGAHEADHVNALTTTIRALGGTPVAAQASYNWPAFANQTEVLTYFHTVEELGAAAYLGQANRITNDDVLTAAVSIHNVEAQHAAVLADLIGVAPSPAFGTPKSMDEVLVVVTPILSGGLPAMPTTGRGGHGRGYGWRALID